MTKHPVHDYINIWQIPGEYLDYCHCCKVVRHTRLGRVTHYNPKERLPYLVDPDLKHRLNLMRGFTGEDSIMVVWKGDSHFGKR